MITPHGGQLVNRMLDGERKTEAGARAASLPVIDLNRREMSDLLLIANGAFSPLRGFMRASEYHSMLEHMRLPDGILWPLPVTLSVGSSQIRSIRTPFQAALRSPDSVLVGSMVVEELFHVDKEYEAKQTLLTNDGKHPGVHYLDTVSDTYAGGPVEMFERPSFSPFEAYDRDPMQTRALFEEKAWRTVCAFQTRNPIHRAHEYLQKCALEIVDGLLIHPIVGETKSDDIPAEVRMECYLALIENYFPTAHVALSILPAAMRYAGPREALFHAIMRQNYGCTHFIVGRDHAGVGNYYGTYDAQKIFDTIAPDDLRITPLFFEHAFYCKKSKAMATKKTTASGPEDRVFLSGTKVREMLVAGQPLPEEFTRREVSDILEKYYKNHSTG